REEALLAGACWAAGSELPRLLAAARAAGPGAWPPALLGGAGAAGGRLGLFLRKLLAHCDRLLERVGGRLGLGGGGEGEARGVLLHVLGGEGGLIEGRRVETVLLCCVYGACKVSGLAGDVKFSSIIAAYKDAARGKDITGVVRDVPLADGSPGNVIQFYNQVFVPRAKDYLMGLQEPGTPPSSPLKRSARAAGLPPHSPFSAPSRVPDSNVFLVSGAAFPNRELTPRSRALFAFGESSSRDLHTINNALNRPPADFLSMPLL
ncbi:hypothetical protein TeGR_g14791, partial [Tetraparma gracilis]